MVILKYEAFNKHQKFVEINESEDRQNDPNNLLRKETQDDVSRCVAIIINKFPFFGEFLINCRFLYDAPGVDTMATDGKNIFVNCRFASKLSDKEMIFVLCHEVLHPIMLHFSRCEKYVGTNLSKAEHERWNIAADHEINPMLVDEGLISADEIKKIGDVGGLYDEKYKKDGKWMPAEPIYDEVKEEDAQNPPNEYPVNVGDVIHTKKGEWAKIKKVNADGSYDAEPMTKEEAVKFLDSQ